MVEFLELVTPAGRRGHEFCMSCTDNEGRRLCYYEGMESFTEIDPELMFKGWLDEKDAANLGNNKMLQVLGIEEKDMPRAPHWTDMFEEKDDDDAMLAIAMQLYNVKGAVTDDTEEDLKELLALSPTDFDADKKDEAERRMRLEFPALIDDPPAALEVCLKQVHLTTKGMNSRIVDSGLSQHDNGSSPTTFLVLEFQLKEEKDAAAKAIKSKPMTYKDALVKVVGIRPNFELERDKLLHNWAEAYAKKHELEKGLHLTVDQKHRVVRRNTDMCIIAMQSTNDWAVSPAPGIDPV